MATAGRAAVIGLVPILLIVAVFGVYLSQTVTPSSSSSTTKTNYSGVASTLETANSTLRLKLVLSVNSTTIPSEDAITISGSILNTLPTVNNLTASNDWAIQGLSSGPCDLGNSTNKLFSPIGFAVFRGFYGLNNLSGAGEPLPIWPAIECIVPLAFNGTQLVGNLHNITSYSLLPQGENNFGNDSGSYAGYYVLPSPSPHPCNLTVCTYYPTPVTFAKGVFPARMDSEATIYAANGTGFYDSLMSSLPSTYTLVAGDEWGQIVLLHFTVTPSSNLPVVGNFLASSGACAESGNPVPCTTSEFSQAFIFNCASEAATSSGCTRQVSSGLGDAGSPLTYYTITVWYPYVNQTNEPARDNCMFRVSGDTTSPYAYCFLINSEAFVLSP